MVYITVLTGIEYIYDSFKIKLYIFATFSYACASEYTIKESEIYSRSVSNSFM